MLQQLLASFSDFVSGPGRVIFILVDVVCFFMVLVLMYEYFGKAVFDVLIATIGLVLLSPIFLVAALSKGASPLFEGVDLAGKKGTPFTLLSFTTRDKDGNLLKAGKFLERTGLKYSPNLLAVFTLKISLVGVKPVSALDGYFVKTKATARFKVRPGIIPYLTDGAPYGAKTYEDMFRSDRKYVEEQSFISDVIALVSHFKRRGQESGGVDLGEIVQKDYVEVLLERGEVDKDTVKKAISCLLDGAQTDEFRSHGEEEPDEELAEEDASEDGALMEEPTEERVEYTSEEIEE